MDGIIFLGQRQVLANLLIKRLLLLPLDAFPFKGLTPLIIGAVVQQAASVAPGGEQCA